MARKVIEVSDADEWSGGAAQLIALSKGLKARGWDVVVACRAGSALARKAAEAGLLVFPVALRQDYDLFSAWRLARFAVSSGAELIHVHHSRSHGVCLMAKALLRMSGQRAPRLVVSRRVSFPAGKNPFSLWKYRSDLIDAFAAVASAVKDVLVAGGVPADKVAVIRSGVDASLFAPRPPDAALAAELGLPPGVPVVGKIANASPWKGQGVFLEAAAKLLAQGRKAHFVLAGRDTDGPWVRGMVSHLELDEHVTLAGFRGDVPRLLSCMAVSVNAAMKGEGLSGALRESLCMGVPVVASDVAGNRELLGRDGTDYLFAPGDSAALAARLADALDHPERSRASAEAWRRHALGEFTLDAMIDKTSALYERLLG